MTSISPNNTSASEHSPHFYVGELPIYGDLILAPMDGYSDSPFRVLARAHGSAVSYSEFINGIDVIGGHPYLNQRLEYSETERPVAYQILDNDVDRIVKTAHKIRSRNPDYFDINIGCSAKNVVHRRAGAGLLLEPEKIAAVFKILSTELDIPLSGKIRLGWDDDNRNYLDIARIVEQNGGMLLAVHGRTREQAYDGLADWDAIAEVKQHISIPVIANGDVCTTNDIQKIIAHTKCDAVMIGRAAVGNPWLFSRIEKENIPLETLHKTMRRHLELMLDFYEEFRGLIKFRKHAKRYLSHLSIEKDAIRTLVTRKTPVEFYQQLQTIIDNYGQ